MSGADAMKFCGRLSNERLSGLAKPLRPRFGFAGTMSRARIFLVLLGITFFVLGLVVGAVFDKSVGLGFFVVGAFLTMLPFLGVHDQE